MPVPVEPIRHPVAPNPVVANQDDFRPDISEFIGGLAKMEQKKIHPSDVSVAGYVISGVKVDQDRNYAFANSDAIGTEQTITWPKPIYRNQYYALTIYNPGASALTIECLQVKRNMLGADRDAKITEFTVDATDTATTILQFPFVNDDMKVSIKNLTAIAEDGAFTGTVRLEVII